MIQLKKMQSGYPIFYEAAEVLGQIAMDSTLSTRKSIEFHAYNIRLGQ